MTSSLAVTLAISSRLVKNATMEYIYSNETPRASACKRTQRGSFFALTVTIQGPSP